MGTIADYKRRCAVVQLWLPYTVDHIPPGYCMYVSLIMNAPAYPERLIA